MIICGSNDENQLGEKSTKKSARGYPIVFPPVKSCLDPKNLLSYSIYDTHAVVITLEGDMYGIGNNKGIKISNSLPDGNIDFKILIVLHRILIILIIWYRLLEIKNSAILKF